MKSLVCSVFALFTSVAGAAEIQTVFSDDTRVAGIHDDLSPDQPPRLCYSGSFTDKICIELKSAIGVANKELAVAASDSVQLKVLECAQSTQVAMLMYDVQGAGLRRSVLVRQCK